MWTQQTSIIDGIILASGSAAVVGNTKGSLSLQGYLVYKQTDKQTNIGVGE